VFVRLPSTYSGGREGGGKLIQDYTLVPVHLCACACICVCMCVCVRVRMCIHIVCIRMRCANECDASACKWMLMRCLFWFLLPLPAVHRGRRAAGARVRSLVYVHTGQEAQCPRGCVGASVCLHRRRLPLAVCIAAPRVSSSLPSIQPTRLLIKLSGSSRVHRRCCHALRNSPANRNCCSPRHLPSHFLSCICRELRRYVPTPNPPLSPPTVSP